MESYEKRSAQAQSEADRLEEEGDRVDRRIDEARSDVQSKQNIPGMEAGSNPGDPGDATDEGEEPNTTSAD